MQCEKKKRKPVTAARIRELLWSIVRGIIIFGICFTILKPLILKIGVSFMNESDLYDASVKYIAKHFSFNNYTKSGLIQKIIFLSCKIATMSLPVIIP